ncbi:MAG TPA: KH domain-containing protein, partial [Actinomycetota bacterium]|nr:KH domain-containing protein [Actinomycetota bacterium]
MTRALVEYAVPWLVDHPDEVTITEVETDGEDTVLELTVHPDDVGKIIGRQG